TEVGDPALAPPLPGLSGKEHCRDWDPGLPVDTARIRPRDEAYWQAHRGTPKAWIPLAVGQALWANRFGALTAIRFSAPGDATSQASGASHGAAAAGGAVAAKAAEDEDDAAALPGAEDASGAEDQAHARPLEAD